MRNSRSSAGRTADSVLLPRPLGVTPFALSPPGRRVARFIEVRASACRTRVLRGRILMSPRPAIHGARGGLFLQHFADDEARLIP